MASFEDSYEVQLTADISFVVMQNRGPLMHIGPFSIDNARAMVWDWMTIWGRGLVEWDSNLYHHEVGHILQQALFGNVISYRAAAVGAYLSAGGVPDNYFEQGANCFAGLPLDWNE